MFFIYSIFLMAIWTGVRTDVQLVQSNSEVKKPGDSVTLSCKTSGFTLTSVYMHWVRQAVGKGLEWVGRIDPANGNTWYAETAKNRCIITTDNPNNMVYLEIKGLKIEDTAVYYCARWGAYLDHWGAGTAVTVTTVEFAPPQVFPLIPCVFPSGDTVTVGCLVSQFFPTPVSVQWTEGAMNLTSNVKTFPAALDSSNSSYTLSSELTIPVSEWKTNSLSCSVSHSFTNTNTTVHLGPRSKPVIRLLQETCPEQDGSGFVRFLCLASNLSSPDVELDWYKGDVLLPASVKYSVTQKQGQYMLLSTQNVSQGDWNSGAIITCRAKDSTGIKAEATISKCSDGLNCLRIDVFLLPPTPEDLLINKRPKVGCLASNLPKNSGYSFTWNRQKSGEKVIITEDAVQHNNGSYSVTSYLEICNEDWESSEPFTCTVEYPGLTAPIVKTIFKKKNIIPLPPVVSVFSPTPEELAQGEMVCCTCLVKSFLPSEIFLKWTEGDEEMDLQAYSTTPPQYEEFNESYFVYSKMCVSYSDWNQGKSYACVVGHEALPMYLTQRSLDKFSARPTPALTYADVDTKEEEEGDDLSVTSATFMVLFLLSVSYSTTITLLKCHLGIQIKRHRMEQDCPHSSHLLP